MGSEGRLQERIPESIFITTCSGWFQVSYGILTGVVIYHR